MGIFANGYLQTRPYHYQPASQPNSSQTLILPSIQHAKATTDIFFGANHRENSKELLRKPLLFLQERIGRQLTLSASKQAIRNFAEARVNSFKIQESSQLSPLDFYRTYRTQLAEGAILPLFLPPVPLTSPEQEKLMGMIYAILEAGTIIREQTKPGANIRLKEERQTDIVTETDLLADETIRTILSKTSPDAAMVTEETASEAQTFNLNKAWVVDPLDGTSAFAHGYPHYGVSIAYLENGAPRLGAILHVPDGQLFVAVAGKGAWQDGRKLKVNPVEDISQAYLGTDFPSIIATAKDTTSNNIQYFWNMAKKSAGIRRDGAVYGVKLAQGQLDGYWQIYTNPWDMAALKLILEEAGAQVTDIHGNPMDLSKRPVSILAAATPNLHREMLKTLHSDAE